MSKTKPEAQAVIIVNIYYYNMLKPRITFWIKNKKNSNHSSIYINVTFIQNNIVLSEIKLA